MRENLLREIAAEYEQLRAQNRAEEQARLERAIAADPEIGVLVQKRQQMFHERARQAFANPAQAMDISASLAQEMDALQKQLRRQLVKAGFAETYLQPVYHCEKCRDTGYVGEVLKDRCECLNRKLQTRMFDRLGNGVDPRETFENYNALIYPDTPLEDARKGTQRAYMERMKARCESFADMFPHNPIRNLMFVGSSGLGKTYLMNCIANRVIQRGQTALKITAYQLSERMRAAVFDNDTEGFRTLIEVPLLLIDDLGSEAILENLSLVQLFTIINERELAGLSTIISTNLDVLQFQQRYTERICSRLFDSRSTLMCNFTGRDVRLGNKKND